MDTVLPNVWDYCHALSVCWNCWERYRAWVASHFMLGSSKKEWTNDEIKELIGVYETHPALWYASCSVWRKKELKNEIFKQFAEAFQCTSQEIGRKLHNLWTTFFSCFSVLPIFCTWHKVQHTAVGPCSSHEHPRPKISSLETVLHDLALLSILDTLLRVFAEFLSQRLSRVI